MFKVSGIEAIYLSAGHKVFCTVSYAFPVYILCIHHTVFACNGDCPMLISTTYPCYPAQGISYMQAGKLVPGKSHPM